MKGVKGTLSSKHVTIWVRPSEWDRIAYLSASSGKDLSVFVVDTVYNYTGKDIIHQINKDEKGVVKPLCVDSEKWSVISERAKLTGQSISNYVLGVLLGK